MAQNQNDKSLWQNKEIFYEINVSWQTTLFKRDKLN